ncbi:MAG TPA: hypothetical protein VHC68_01585, partial [Candidatus Paceibacterota bacterium]|nr:hypothetical protein [Candidatus Paceibacterota bacterium]
FTIDQGVGPVTPVAAGSTTVSPTTTTTYTGTAKGAGGTVHCSATVTVVTNPPPSCTLTASPTQVASGGTSTLTWTTTHATSFSIDQGIGTLTPTSGGSTTTPPITSDTTYTGTATGPGGTVTCTAAVTVQSGGGGGGPACTLTASPTQVASVGDTATLTWTTSGAISFFLDNGIGTSTPTSGGSTTTPPVNSNTTYTGTATAADGATVTCTATVTIPSGGGGGGCTGSCCSGGCGGGGGGGGPLVYLSALPHPVNQPLAYLYLSQIPYTGLDLGPVGTVLYWFALGIWCLAAAYLILFGLLPWLARKARDFGLEVAGALEGGAFALAPAGAAPRAPAGASAPIAQPVLRSGTEQQAALAPRHSPYEGFKSFATGGTLSIDDIVKGLSRSPQSAALAEREGVEPPAVRNIEPIYENVEPIQMAAEMPAPEPARTAPSAKPVAPLAPEVPSFIAALIAGKREEVYATLRQLVQSGADAEAFIAQVSLALDDAYRARTEGAPVHQEIAALTKNLATPVLERLVSSLTSAVDSTYSIGITGAKLALTRALGVLGA